jgi:hypothetical protein
MRYFGLTSSLAATTSALHAAFHAPGAQASHLHTHCMPRRVRPPAAAVWALFFGDGWGSAACRVEPSQAQPSQASQQTSDQGAARQTSHRQQHPSPPSRRLGSLLTAPPTAFVAWFLTAAPRIAHLSLETRPGTVPTRASRPPHLGSRHPPTTALSPLLSLLPDCIARTMTTAPSLCTPNSLL